MTDAAHDRFLRVYCPTHKTTFTTAGGHSILCESGGESLAKNFPYDSAWEYCCVCRTYWPVDLFRSNKGRKECPVCNRRIAQSYLCDECNLLTLEPDAPAHLKRFSIPPNGSQPLPCPGCLAVVKSALHPHHCTEAEVDFLTARHACPFCEELIARQEVTAQQGLSTPPVSLPLREKGVSVKPRSQAAMSRSKPIENPALTLPTSRPPVADFVPTRTLPPPQSHAVVRGKISKKIVIAGAVVAVIVVLYTVAVILRVTSSPRENEIKDSPPQGMTYVPGGEFMMGRDNGDEFERPQHKVSVKPFYIDLYETTCEEYDKFIRATGHAPPASWKKGKYPEGAARQPVTGVDWDDANAYAAWSGKRLPTEEEWEFAARGSDGRLYPWGNEWKSEAANADTSSQGGMVEIGKQAAGKAAYGSFDMAGNAWEWTASDLKAYPGGQLPAKLPDNLKVIRGGSWQEDRTQVTATYRGYWPARGNQDYKRTGFRCVKDVSSKAVPE